MNKRELIDEILSINTSAEAAFLAEFEDRDLAEYLTKLRKLLGPQGARSGWSHPARPPAPEGTYMSHATDDSCPQADGPDAADADLYAHVDADQGEPSAHCGQDSTSAADSMPLFALVS